MKSNQNNDVSVWVVLLFIFLPVVILASIVGWTSTFRDYLYTPARFFGYLILGDLILLTLAVLYLL